MIKIIKRGEKNKEPDYRLTCHQCGCEFTAEQGDVKADDRPCSDPYIPCPQCCFRVNTMEK